MTSLGEVIARLRAATDLLRPGELTEVAERLGADVLPVLGQLAQESNRSELAEAFALLAPVPDRLSTVAALFDEVINRVEGYIQRQGGTGTVDPPAPQGTADGSLTSPESILAAQRRSADRELIAEALRNGLKISPERVLYIGRDQTGRIIWLEEGDDRAGAQHILRAKRREEFAVNGIAPEDVLDLVWRAVTGGKPVGIAGRGAVVFAVSYRGEDKLIAVGVGGNGFITTAYPKTDRRKLKPL
ncbi:hypothetical protein [Goodfellowiella coeruleoviolacea]|uniref:Uncharacterized protein n=1 Tax=Goodfellowiella coeruleoviolacea TaxID=334858 RepID=A0AAE3GA38_9PSEU|nr:hypothetical protein [Goodfellowiella coeruleoviolacea]MCP2164476.1 hypothetical protein [Goodfellowiella coeruleoviolacea]